MKKYFKSESKLKKGIMVEYIEFDGENPTRQVRVDADQWIVASEQYHPLELIDQPLSATDLGPEDEISREEFEKIWGEAQRRGR